MYIFALQNLRKKYLVGKPLIKDKDIGTLARRDLQELFEKKCILNSM